VREGGIADAAALGAGVPQRELRGKERQSGRLLLATVQGKSCQQVIH